MKELRDVATIQRVQQDMMDEVALNVGRQMQQPTRVEAIGLSVAPLGLGAGPEVGRRTRKLLRSSMGFDPWGRALQDALHHGLQQGDEGNNANNNL